MKIRDELKRRALSGFRSLVKRAEDFASTLDTTEEETETSEVKETQQKTTTQEKVPLDKVPDDVKLELQKKKQKAAKTKTQTPPPPPPSSVMPGSSDDNPGTLLQQLAEASSMTNDIVRRLDAFGMGDKAREVVSATVGSSINDLQSVSAIGITAKLAVDQAKEALKLAFQALDRQKDLDLPARELRAKAERLAQSADQAAQDVEDQVNALDKRVEEMESKLGFDRSSDNEYDWDRKSLVFGFSEDVKALYKKLQKEWKRLAIGVKRKDGVPVGDSPFAPRAYARSSTLTVPKKIPMYAFSNPDAFAIWAEDNGFGDGLALEVDGFIYGQSGLSVIR